MNKKTYTIGIDLGTTYSCAAVFNNDRPETIPNFHGANTTPSVLAFVNGQRLVGEVAKKQQAKYPKQTIFNTKRIIGRSFFDQLVETDIQRFPFDVINQEGKPVIRIDVDDEQKLFAPEEISAAILSKLRDSAEKHLGGVVKNAVITVPAYFNDSQRQATRDAGAIAGLNVVRIINEPTAAAIAYGLGKNNQQEQIVLVFDLGGGTFDVSILAIEDGLHEVKATDGDSHFGGVDFDNRLVDHCLQGFAKEHGKRDINPRALSRLRTACEGAKRDLSEATNVTIDVEAFVGGIDLSVELTRTQFEDLSFSLFEKIRPFLQKVIEDAKVDKSDVDDIILVGGSTRIPGIREQLSQFFEGKTLNSTVNPDEAVAHGAAIQAAILDKNPSLDVLLHDVTSQSIGISTGYERKIRKLIERNTSIPAEGHHIFTTVKDNQTEADIEVYQGEERYADENDFLGRCRLEGLRPARSGAPKIKVTIALNEEGMVVVSAIDQESKMSTKASFARPGHDVKNVDRMAAEARKFETGDRDALQVAEERHKLESCLSSMRKRKVGDSVSLQLSEAVSDCTKWFNEHPRATVPELVAMRHGLEALASGRSDAREQGTNTSRNDTSDKEEVIMDEEDGLGRDRGPGGEQSLHEEIGPDEESSPE